MKIPCLLFLSLCLLSVNAQQAISDSSATGRKAYNIRTVEVQAKRNNENILNGAAGQLLDVVKIKNLPKLIGETDPYRSLQYMGGISQASDGNGGLYVRGGNNDQNLILLNGSQLNAPNHIFGIFSIFNADIIDQMRFIKSGIPAEYGSRSAAVVDINTTTQIPEKTQIDGSVGLILSRIAIKTALTNKLMLYGAVRSSYISYTVLPLMRLAKMDTSITNSRYDFYDINAGFSYKPNAKSKLSGHFYTGKDNIQIGSFKRAISLENNTTNWGNTAASLLFNHIFSEQFSTNQTLSFTTFALQSSLNWLGSINQLKSKKTTISYRNDNLLIAGKHTIRFGLQSDFQLIKPKRVLTDSLLPIENNHTFTIYRNILNSIYIRDELELGRWQLNAGLRCNYYIAFGTQTVDETNRTDNYSLKPEKSYINAEPRFFARYLLNETSSVKASVGQVYQYINQIPLLSMGVPFEMHLPATAIIAPQNTWQFSAGYFRNFINNKLELGLETYYKTMNHLLEFNNSISTSILNNISDEQVYQGKGHACGGEFSLHFNDNRWSAWINYNLGWSIRQFDQINNGNSYYANNDRRHNLSAIGMYKLSDKWSFSALFVYASGNRLNLPVSWYIINGNLIWEYNKYNSFKMPDYHRLDLSANYRLKEIHGIRSEINISVYNIYNRANPYQVFFSTKSADKKYNYKLQMAWLLPIIPSISWTFHI